MKMPPVITKNEFTVAWLAWIAMFMLIEGLAIWSDVPRATLSHHIRDWLRARETWVLVLAWAFMLWLTAHFLLDLRR